MFGGVVQASCLGGEGFIDGAVCYVVSARVYDVSGLSASHRLNTSRESESPEINSKSRVR